MRVAKIKDYVYGKTIWLTFGTNEEVSRWYEKKGINDVNEMNKYHEAFSCFIIRDEKKYEVRDIHVHFQSYGFSTIVHETNHITFYVLNDAGIQLSQETTEPFAYYQDWISGKIRDQFEKWIAQDKKRKKKNVSK